MNINTLKELFSIANSLDAKGFTKIADDLDKVAQDIGASILKRDPDFGSSTGGEIGTIDFEMPDGIRGTRDRYLRSQESAKGRIQPKGDPFTYDYLFEEDAFIVRTAPPRNFSAVGAKFRSDHPAYKTLRQILGDDFDRLVAENKLTQKMADTELSAPEFGGHSGMQDLYSDISDSVGEEQAMKMFTNAKMSIQKMHKERGLTEDSLLTKLKSAGFNDSQASDYLFHIRQLPKYTSKFKA